jgi:hypothetical protein
MFKSMLLVLQKGLASYWYILQVLLQLKSIASFIWAHFGLLPFANNLDKPALYVDRGVVKKRKTPSGERMKLSDGRCVGFWIPLP